MLIPGHFQNPILTKQNCPVIWFFGLSGAGKSTLAKGLSEYLAAQGLTSYLLDGDALRNGINKDLGFSQKDRNENLRRAAEVARLFQKSGLITLCSFITPTLESRDIIAGIIEENFYDVFVNCSLEECEKRDVKGLYKKARLGEIPDFTGVTAPFEIPENSFLILNTEENDYSSCLNQLINVLQAKNILSATNALR